MVQAPRFLSILFASAALSTGQPTPDAGNEAADKLWASFLENYRTFSLKALDPVALDEKARAALIETGGAKFRSWKATDQPTVLDMAGAMSAQDGSVSKFVRIEKALEKMLPQIDTYGSYHLASDVSQLREALKQNAGSVHMTLDQAPDGTVVCYPQDGGPAASAGITSGATLLAVDNRPSKGRSLPSLRLGFVGPPGAPVLVKVMQTHGKIEEFNIIRTDKPAANVVVTQSPLGLNVRIRKFDTGTASQVKQELEAHGTVKRLSLDLRGNPGGVRDEALKIASLFFPKGTPLGTFTTNTGVQTASDGNDVIIHPDSIRILQDERTASASEYLIATLKDGMPDKVSIFGTRSYGKSHSTARVSLEGGGELSVTEALLATGTGRSWEKTGIKPDQKADK